MANFVTSQKETHTFVSTILKFEFYFFTKYFCVNATLKFIRQKDIFGNCHIELYYNIIHLLSKF